MNSGYTPKTKKIVYISSSEESDSDSENVTNNISTTPKRKLQKNKTGLRDTNSFTLSIA